MSRTACLQRGMISLLSVLVGVCPVWVHGQSSSIASPDGRGFGLLPSQGASVPVGRTGLDRLGEAETSGTSRAAPEPDEIRTPVVHPIAVNTSPTITLTSPNGGEVWQAGTTQTITWTSTNTTGDEWVAITLYEGDDWRSWIGEPTAGAGNFDWTIPPWIGDGSDYRVLVHLCDGNGCFDDYSDAPFEIFGSVPPPTITVTSPNGGEVWQAGTTQTITWTSTNTTGDEPVYLRLFEGDDHRGVIGESTAGAGSFDWAIPPWIGDGDDYRLHLALCDHHVCSFEDSSDGPFEIFGSVPPPTITVSSPNGGEVWSASTTQTITWTSTNTAGDEWVSIQLYEGDDYRETIGQPTVGAGSFDWAIQHWIGDSTDYRVYVRAYDAAWLVAEDLSDGPFSITGSWVCVHDEDCDDGDLCTDDACVELACLNTQKDCSGGVCDPATGACVECLGSSECDDGLFCNGVESCVDGECVVGISPCLIGVCDEDAHVCAQCVTSDDCFSENLCLIGTCIAHVCEYADRDCGDELCDPWTGECVECLTAADCPIPADPCMVATCGGVCGEAAKDCDNQICDPETGECIECSIDTHCDDGLWCNGVEACDGSLCVAGIPPCGEGQSCDEATQQCADLTCEANRSLPACYQKGRDLTVRVAFDPPAGAFAVGLEDSPPMGWNVGNISDGGSWDPVHRKVKWLFFDGQARTVNYTVNVPGEQTGEVCFAGAINFDGGPNQPICGDRCLDDVSCRYHPADDDYSFSCSSCPNAGCTCAVCQDWRIELCEIVGYICTWRAGCQDDMPAVVRGVYLYRNAEDYCWDEGLEQWFPAGQCGASRAPSIAAVEPGSGRADRYLGGVYRPGHPLTVQLQIDPPAGTFAMGFEDLPPAGWTPGDISDGGSWDPVHEKVKWVFFDGEPRTVSYTVDVPVLQTGEVCFAGSINFDGGPNEPIVGEECVSQVPPAMAEALSRRSHGPAGVFDIDVTTSGATESRVGGPTTLVVLFDQDVESLNDVDPADVSLSSGTVTGLEISGPVLTILLNGVSNLQPLLVAFPGIRNSAGLAVVDTLCIEVLAGDANGDGAVNVLDLVQVRNQLNQPVTLGNFRADVNADGAINILDLVAVRNRLNTAATPCP